MVKKIIFMPGVKIISICCCLAILLSCGKADQQPPARDYSLNYLTLGIAFPPVASSDQRDFTAPLLAELNVKQIRIAESWAAREPTPGNFNWQPLDERLNWAFENNIRVLLTIQSDGPDWACSPVQNDKSCVYNDNAAFKNYAELLMQRYAGKIDRIQFGNEWQSSFWYAGNAQQFTEASNVVYQAIQAYAPGTRMVLGGFTAISLRFLAGCNGQVTSFYDDEGIFYDSSTLADMCQAQEILDVFDRITYVLNNALYDEIDIHLYDDVENWGAYYSNFKDMVQKPIIVSEFGGPNMNYEPYTEDYQAERLYAYIKTLDSLQIEEAYYFKLVDGTDNPAHARSSLIRSSDLGKKPGFTVFKEFTAGQ